MKNFKDLAMNYGISFATPAQSKNSFYNEDDDFMLLLERVDDSEKEELIAIWELNFDGAKNAKNWAGRSSLDKPTE